MGKLGEILSICLMVGVIATAMSSLLWGGLVLIDVVLDKPIVLEVSGVEHTPTTHQVMPNDTLWGIARMYYPNNDPRDVIDMLKRENGLKSDVLHPYTMVIKLPAGVE